MQMPEELFALMRRFALTFPPPRGLPGAAHEEACRQWTTHLAQQAVSVFPQGNYGCKRASDDGPLSTDTIAQFADQFRGWDVLLGAGTGAPAVIGAPTQSIDLYGQVFVPVVGHDWLKAGPNGSPTGAIPPEAPQPDPPCCCCQVLEVLKAELAAANEQRQAGLTLQAKILAQLERQPTLQELYANPIPVKFRW